MMKTVVDLDDDSELEVVIGSYSSPSSSNQIFAINPDGTNVEGFPLTIGEKMKAGLSTNIKNTVFAQFIILNENFPVFYSVTHI